MLENSGCRTSVQAMKSAARNAGALELLSQTCMSATARRSRVLMRGATSMQNDVKTSDRYKDEPSVRWLVFPRQDGRNAKRLVSAREQSIA